MTDYFSRTEYVSNSDLGDLKVLMSGEEVRDLSPYYEFGSLFDALVTEPQRIEQAPWAVYLDGKEIDQLKWELAYTMYEHSKKDAMLKLFCMCANKQKECYEKIEIEYEGHIFSMPVRCKLDFYVPTLNMGGDLKSTACSNLREFLAAIELFDYDRQAAWYMDIADLTCFVIIGVSKKLNKRTEKHEVFKYVIKRDSPEYIRGKAKYQKLAFYYKTLILSLYANT